MQALVIAEQDSGAVRRGSLSALAFARSVVSASGGTDADVSWLILGDAIDAVSADAARYAPVIAMASAELATPVADRHARAIATVSRDRGVQLVVAASTTFAKDIVARAGGLLGGAMASDVVGHELTEEGDLVLSRPVYAGSVTARVKLLGEPRIVTVRPSAYEPAPASDAPFEVESVAHDEEGPARPVEVVSVESKATERPDVTEARIVVSGGRAFKTTADFESHVGALADALGGAAGSSRALVDAGITPNELQVGQTGKIVAPELYMALGLSGAVQHLAGMKNSKVIVAVNKDPDAPIFEVADYGLVADVYEVVPEMLEKIRASG